MINLMHVTSTIVVLKQPRNIVEVKDDYNFELERSLFSLSVPTRFVCSVCSAKKKSGREDCSYFAVSSCFINEKKVH